MVYRPAWSTWALMSPRHPVVNLWGMLTAITPYRAPDRSTNHKELMVVCAAQPR